MAISYPITLPLQPSLRSISITPKNGTVPVPSPFTFQTQVQVWSGQAWVAKCSIPAGRRATMGKWVAAMTSLCGSKGSFLLGDTAHTSPRGVGTGTPLVNGGGQSGSSLVTDGWTASVTGILKAYDYIQLGTGNTARLYMVLQDVNSNGSGQATLDIWPNLRSAPADNAVITINSPMSKFMLPQDISWDIDEAKIFGLEFSAVEDLRP